MLSCLEPFNIVSNNFESTLVVEATITNELKNQTIKLGRSFSLDASGPNPETNASVFLTDVLGNNYTFSENENGVYGSDQEFAAEKNITYILTITTADGGIYKSSEASFNGLSTIDSYEARATTFNGVDGVGIFLDSSDPLGNSRYYRYTYEETYEIRAPYWSPQELVIIDLEKFTVGLELKTEPNRICYNTIFSNTILLNSTNDLTVDEVSNFQIHFIPKSASILRYRYSILVNQYSQSREAYVFYETLKDFSSSESVFSESQPGFFNGNLFSEGNPNEKVIGFFEVSSVVSQRLFFNFRDIYSLDLLPDYFVDCQFIAPLLRSPDSSLPAASPLMQEINNGFNIFYTYNPELEGGQYLLVNRKCGDCTPFGTTVKPEFWVE